ncbi:hypothetical protein [Boseongicola aestuarii]|uniref:Uncharacterized protein n=1 Tax=Boseongicola aestuarii TaxID=1470561 RepID=A0A238IYW9_9RHOB|nr:hypothetical protein [Boseongicola aestuarii]SMX23172.1 hypothetical protein BOA8489_01276 [Boseongicola aestuarii]
MAFIVSAYFIGALSVLVALDAMILKVGTILGRQRSGRSRPPDPRESPPISSNPYNTLARAALTPRTFARAVALT